MFVMPTLHSTSSWWRVSRFSHIQVTPIARSDFGHYSGEGPSFWGSHCRWFVRPSWRRVTVVLRARCCSNAQPPPGVQRCWECRPGDNSMLKFDCRCPLMDCYRGCCLNSTFLFLPSQYSYTLDFFLPAESKPYSIASSQPGAISVRSHLTSRKPHQLDHQQLAESHTSSIIYSQPSASPTRSRPSSRVPFRLYRVKPAESKHSSIIICQRRTSPTGSCADSRK
jgi:hypothetical protein